jgi:phage terminase small subunit
LEANRDEVFVDEYVKGLNGTRAAIAEGYGDWSDSIYNPV